MRHAEEGIDGERHRPGHAFHGQVTFDCNDLVALEFDFVRLVSDGREHFGIEQIGGLDVLVEQCRSGVDRFGVDHDIHRPCFGRAVEGNRAGGLVETAQLDGITKVAVFETRHGMRGFDGIRFRSGGGDGCDRSGKGQCDESFHDVLLWWVGCYFFSVAAVKTKWNLICISLATVPRSAHTPSPML